MKTIIAALAQQLAGEVTTLATWRIMRRDRVVLGFTDHVRNLEVEGVTYTAASGYMRLRSAARPTSRSTTSTSRAYSRTTASPKRTCARASTTSPRSGCPGQVREAGAGRPETPARLVRRGRDPRRRVRRRAARHGSRHCRPLAAPMHSRWCAGDAAPRVPSDDRPTSYEEPSMVTFWRDTASSITWDVSTADAIRIGDERRIGQHGRPLSLGRSRRSPPSHQSLPYRTQYSISQRHRPMSLSM
jgi:Uncharacterized conserved protein (DUF2163)